MRSSGDLPVEELQLPRGPYNALRRANVRTLTDLLALPVEDIAGIPSLGPRALAQVCRGLDEYANALMPRLHEEPTFCDTPIEALGLSKDLGEKLRSAGISAVDDLGPSSSFRLAEILGPKMAHAVLAKTEALKILLLMDPARADERFPARGNDSAAEAAYTQQTRTEHGSRSVVDLSSLDLSVRAHNALKRAGIDTLETLVGMNEDEILSIRNVGRKTLAEILEVIRRCSAVVHGEAEIDEPTASRVKLVKDLDLPFRVWKVLAQAHVVTLKHLTAFSQERMLDQLPVRWEDVRAIERALVRVGLALAAGEPRCPMVDRDLVALAERKQVPLDHIPIERLVFPRAWNRLLREAGIDTVGQLCQASEVVLQARLPRGDRTVGHMRQRLENYLPWLVEQRSWDSEVLQQGASPVFRTELAETSLDQMLAEFLDCLHTDRQQVVIRLRWGLNQAEPKTLEETGKSIGVTRERVRQIQDRATRQLRRPSNRMVIELLLEMLQEILVQAGGLAATQYLAETLERTVGIVNVNTRNAVRFLCSVDSRFIALRKDTWGLKGYPLHRVQDINRVMVDILEDKHGFAPRPEILAEFRTTELHEELGGHVTNGFLDACLDSNPGIEISADGECALKRRASARLHSMVKALRNIGRPAHYSEIAREVNELLPERQRAPTHAIHAHMGRLPDIFVRCGRGVFGLAEWGLHQDRSLADAAYRVLAEIGRPLHVERIIDNVLDTWRVERTSVYAAIQSDDRFYRVGEGVYWLRDRIGQTEGKKGKGRGFGEVYGASLLERQETLEAWQGRESIDTHDEVEKIRRIGSGLFDSKRKSR